MIITFHQSGGIADRRKTIVIDTDRLGDDKQKVENLIEQAQLRENLKLQSIGNDLINYAITMEQDGKTIHFSSDEISVPDKVKPLLDYLKEQAK